MIKRKKGHLVNSRADEFAAKNNITEQDGEIPTRFRVLALLIQHVTGYGHQIGPVSIRRVIHRRRPINNKSSNIFD